jgi:hypothetical protein
MVIGIISPHRDLTVDIDNSGVTATGSMSHNDLFDLTVPGILLKLIRIENGINRGDQNTRHALQPADWATL